MAKVTLDTNVFPATELLAFGQNLGDTFAIVSVTQRELDGHPLHASVCRLGAPIAELAVWDESPWNDATWADEKTSALLANILRIISNGSFPASHTALSPGQLRQLRDAMIFEAHVRANRDIFLTNDRRAFISNGRREKFQALHCTVIQTPAEYVHAPPSARCANRAAFKSRDAS